METGGIAVSGQHVSPEERPHLPHVEEVIVQANQQLADPEAAPTPAYPEIAALDTLNLDSNFKFAQLRKAIETYVSDSKSARTRVLYPGKSEKWTGVLYSSLMQALTELLFAPTREQQLAYLDRIHAWFTDKTRMVYDLPKLRKDPGPEHAHPSTTIATQDNSIKARQERMRLRKMDVVPTIESRGSSPTKSPVLPRVVDRAHSYMRVPKSAKDDPSDDLMDKYLSHVLLWQHRELSEFRTRRMSEKLVHQWSIARAKRDEELLARAEISSMRPRGATAFTKNRDTETSLGGDFSRSNISTTIDSSKGLGYIDCRQERPVCESPDPVEPRSTASPTSLERLRIASRNIVKTSGGIAYIKPDRCSLSCYQPDSHSPDVSFMSQLDVSLDREKEDDSCKKVRAMTSIRRKLVSAQVACSYRTLNSGLHRPEELAKVSPEFLPAGGEYFTPNPFSKLGKKKKKGKKGKKKKK